MKRGRVNKDSHRRNRPWLVFTFQLPERGRGEASGSVCSAGSRSGRETELRGVLLGPGAGLLGIVTRLHGTA